MSKEKNVLLKDILQESLSRHRAVGQFNFSTACQLAGIAEASRQTQTPVICGTSENEASFVGIETAVFLRDKFKKEMGVNLFLNLDHGKSFETIKKAVDAGYDMVHFDGSEMTVEESTQIAQKVVRYAQEKGVVVEGEISKIGGSSAVSEQAIEEEPLTSLDKIVKFIADTKVDCVALDVGNVHGIYSTMPQLHLERINELLEKVSCFVVLHGGSGIEDVKIKDAVNRGVVKININTELRISWRDAIRNEMKNKPQESTPYKILPTGSSAVCQKVMEKINLFNNL